MKTQGIDYFGRQHPLARLHTQSTVKMRYKMYQFLNTTVNGVERKNFLDHGSTPDTQREASNCFLRWLIQDGATVYATSPEDIQHLSQHISGLMVLNWPLEQDTLPQVLQYTLSSAVIEHVGSEQDQIDYIESLLKLSPCLFMTTPNRFHWLEFHTKFPLLHWLPRSLHRRVLAAIGFEFWAKEKNMRLISKSEFEAMIQSAAQKLNSSVELIWYTPKFLGTVSNLCVLIRRSSEPLNI